MKVNDYVRTDKGLIGKVIKKEEYNTHTILEYKGQYCKRVLSTTGIDSEVIKSSPNIIDLIQVGDYVNGERVEEVWEEVVLVGQECRPISFNNIKSIVTREQFKSMEYKVGD